MTHRPRTRVNAGGKPAADRARRARDHSVTTMTAYPLLARRRAVAVASPELANRPTRTREIVRPPTSTCRTLASAPVPASSRWRASAFSWALTAPTLIAHARARDARA